MSNVDHKCAEYLGSFDDWTLVSDVCKGESTIKEAKEKYLPKPNPTDKSKENETRYSQYVARAVFLGATSRTLNGLIGAVFRKDPVVEIPSAMEYVNSNIDGCGVSLFQQSQKLLGGVLKNGRAGLLADYPETEGAVSKAQLAKVKARVIAIDATSVINWRTAEVDGEIKLTLVVISEVHIDDSDPFKSVQVEQLRVLLLSEGVYTVQIWRKIKEQWTIVSEVTPTDGSGSTWKEIPFTFVGSENNDPAVDPIPLLDLANINVAHYRNSADYEDSVYMCGQPQAWISGLSVEWRDHLEKKGIYIGARTAIPLPENGAFGFAQAQPNTLAKEAMDQKEKQMVALGARLIEKGTVAKTATEAQNENESQHSVLSLAAENVSEAYVTALGWAARYANAPEEIEFSLNKDFVESRLEAQLLQALISAWQSGQLPSSDLWSQLRKYGVIDSDKTDEEIQSELDSDSSGLGLDDDGD